MLSYFPEFTPDTISPWLQELTIEHLLTMTVGQDPDPTAAIVSRDSNWVKAFLATPIKVQPGTRFLYNSMATYMAGAIVQKVTVKASCRTLHPDCLNHWGLKAPTGKPVRLDITQEAGDSG